MYTIATSNKIKLKVHKYPVMDSAKYVLDSSPKILYELYEMTGNRICLYHTALQFQ